MEHSGRIDATRDAVRYLAERAVTHPSVTVANTPAWNVCEVATHVGWALWFWRHMMDAAPDDTTARDRALSETPPFPTDLGPDDFMASVEPVFSHMSADEHAPCYVSMAGGPGTRGLWARHALSEIGVHRMDVESALDEPHGLTTDQAIDAVDYVATFVLPAFRRMTGEDPGSLTLQLVEESNGSMVAVSVDSASPAGAVVRGPAEQLLLGLWGRPHNDVEVVDGEVQVWRSWIELPGRSFQFADER